MEKKANFVKYFFISIGLFTILFCLSVPVVNIEKQLRRFYESQVKFQEKEAERDFDLAEYNVLKKNIQESNFEVDQTANQISILILNAGSVNDSILRMMNDPAKASNLADSLAVLEKSIKQNELIVDSLNIIFEKNSETLLKMMEKYNKHDYKLRLMNIELKGLEDYTLSSRIILFTNIALSVLIIFLGIFLFLKGLVMKNQPTDS